MKLQRVIFALALTLSFVATSSENMTAEEQRQAKLFAAVEATESNQRINELMRMITVKCTPYPHC